jgi:hypothetical protein
MKDFSASLEQNRPFYGQQFFPVKKYFWGRISRKSSNLKTVMLTIRTTSVAKS